MSKNYRAELSACLGDPVDGNPTGVMQEAAFAACGLNWRYLTIRVKDGDLKQAFAGMKAMDFSCCNLTMPHKRTIIPLLDGLTQAAQIIGAVNTVLCREKQGFNTDAADAGLGASAAFSEAFDGVISYLRDESLLRIPKLLLASKTILSALGASLSVTGKTVLIRAFALSDTISFSSLKSSGRPMLPLSAVFTA